MPSIALTLPELARLKQLARTQIPVVQHGHVLEALARALGFNTWAACNGVVGQLPAGAFVTLNLFVDAARERLIELGYESAVVQGLSLCQKDPQYPLTLERLQRSGIEIEDVRQVISSLLERRSKILVAGPAGSGKTTLMHVLLAEMATRHPNDRFGLIQDFYEQPRFPGNVTQFVRNWEPEERRYVTLEKTPVNFDDYHALAIDDIREPIQAALTLGNWQRNGLGIGTIISNGKGALDRLAAIMGSTSGLQTIDACIYMKRGAAGGGVINNIEIYRDRGTR